MALVAAGVMASMMSNDRVQAKMTNVLKEDNKISDNGQVDLKADKIEPRPVKKRVSFFASENDADAIEVKGADKSSSKPPSLSIKGTVSRAITPVTLRWKAGPKQNKRIAPMLKDQTTTEAMVQSSKPAKLETMSSTNATIDTNSLKDGGDEIETEADSIEDEDLGGSISSRMRGTTILQKAINGFIGHRHRNDVGSEEEDEIEKEDVVSLVGNSIAQKLIDQSEAYATGRTDAEEENKLFSIIKKTFTRGVGGVIFLTAVSLYFLNMKLKKNEWSFRGDRFSSGVPSLGPEFRIREELRKNSVSSRIQDSMETTKASTFMSLRSDQGERSSKDDDAAGVKETNHDADIDDVEVIYSKRYSVGPFEPKFEENQQSSGHRYLSPSADWELMGGSDISLFTKHSALYVIGA